MELKWNNNNKHFITHLPVATSRRQSTYCSARVCHTTHHLWMKLTKLMNARTLKRINSLTLKYGTHLMFGDCAGYKLTIHCIGTIPLGVLLTMPSSLV